MKVLTSFRSKAIKCRPIGARSKAGDDTNVRPRRSLQKTTPRGKHRSLWGRRAQACDKDNELQELLDLPFGSPDCYCGELADYPKFLGEK